MPRGAVPPATTIFIELHESDDSELLIELYLWVPCYPLQHQKLAPIHHDCTAQRVYMDSCGKHCTYDKFKSIINDKIAATGSYIELCTPYSDNHTTIILNDSSASHPHHNSQHHTSTHHHNSHKQSHILPWLTAAGALIIMIAISSYLYTQYRRHQYQQLPEYQQYPSAE